MWSVIKFLNAKKVRPAEIHKKIFEVYGIGAMNEGIVRKWCRLFKVGTINVPDEERSGRANSSSCKFYSILHTVPTLHQVIITCFSISRNVWPATV
jgi:hypothetical protein